MTDDDLMRIEAQVRGGGYNPATVNAERLALAAEVRRLHSDLVHARMWANQEGGESYSWPVRGRAAKAASDYCWDAAGNLQHVTASDGWQIGHEVTP